MVGGSSHDQFDFDPTVARIVTDEINLSEPLYPTQEWYPVPVGSLNRFLSIDGQSHEQLIVVPGQYRANGPTASIGTERLYDSLDFVVYHAPFTDTDFLAPNIWKVDAALAEGRLSFHVKASDDSGSLARIVVLYRRLNTKTWSLVDLAYDPLSGQAGADVQLPSGAGTFEYFVQAVDPAGNVALVLSHGVPYTVSGIGMVYLPLVQR